MQGYISLIRVLSMIIGNFKRSVNKSMTLRSRLALNLSVSTLRVAGSFIWSEFGNWFSINGSAAALDLVSCCPSAGSGGRQRARKQKCNRTKIETAKQVAVCFPFAYPIIHSQQKAVAARTHIWEFYNLYCDSDLSDSERFSLWTDAAPVIDGRGRAAAAAVHWLDGRDRKIKTKHRETPIERAHCLLWEEKPLVQRALQSPMHSHQMKYWWLWPRQLMKHLEGNFQSTIDLLIVIKFGALAHWKHYSPLVISNLLLREVSKLLFKSPYLQDVI